MKNDLYAYLPEISFSGHCLKRCSSLLTIQRLIKIIITLERKFVVDEEENDAEAHIAFLYSQLELKRRQIHRIEADLSGDEEDQLEELEELNNDGLDLYEEEDSNDGVMLMDDNDMDALRGDEEEEGEEELVFDPILQCFYSPKTNQYYESK